MQKLICVIAVLVTLRGACFGATMTDRVQAAAASGKYAYVMFYRSNDAATKQMARTIDAHVTDLQAEATWVTVNVRDRKESRLIRRFDASRIPLPAVFGVAPNGAVTGVYRQRVNREQLASAILTPMYADMIKALQSQKISIVCLMPSSSGLIPAGVQQFEADPSFQGQLHRITISAADDAEAEFFARMRVDRNITTPVVMLFAPPGTHLGTYDGNVDASTLAEKVHASGQCNCSKCKAKRK